MFILFKQMFLISMNVSLEKTFLTHYLVTLLPSIIGFPKLSYSQLSLLKQWKNLMAVVVTAVCQTKIDQLNYKSKWEKKVIEPESLFSLETVHRLPIFLLLMDLQTILDKVYLVPTYIFLSKLLFSHLLSNVSTSYVISCLYKSYIYLERY